VRIGLFVFVAACTAAPPSTIEPPTAPTPSAQAGATAPPKAERDEPHAPVMVRGRAIDPWTGAEVASLIEPRGLEFALPVTRDGVTPLAAGNDPYAIGDATVDPLNRTVTTAKDPVHFDGSQTVVRDRGDGTAMWTFRLQGNARSVRPPDLVIARDRIFLADYDATGQSFITALSADRGQLLWRVASSADRLFAHDDLVLSTDGSVRRAPDHRWLVARRGSDGSEAWRLELPLDCDPDAMSEEGAFARIQATNFTRTFSWVFDPETGAVVHELAEYVIAAAPLDDGAIYITDRRVARLRRGGAVVWERPPFDHTFVAGGGFVATGREGELVLYAFGIISDSGVQLVRLRTDTGAIAWAAEAKGLGVPHSKYFHQAYVRVIGDNVVVVSQGASGDFIEVLDLGTGDSLRRHLL
jgi:outer membrane protein assembly factor BamB